MAEENNEKAIVPVGRVMHPNSLANLNGLRPGGAPGWTDEARKAPKDKKRASFNKTLRDMLIDEGLKMSGVIENGVEKTKMQRVVSRVFEAAEEGEAWAVQVIFDRTEGKVPIAAPANEDQVLLIIRGASTDDI